MKMYENDLYKSGYLNVGGLDEAGRGCWAGPLVIAICVFEPNYINKEINDSKKLSAKKRQEVFQQIVKDAILVDWVIYDANFIDLHNPKQASTMGMEFLINKHKNNLDYCLIDYEKINTGVPTRSITKGDSKSQTIAAASIVAKTIRDQIMCEIDLQYPNYFFKSHKGYGTKKHYDAIVKYHPIKNIHRFSYKPIKNIINLLNLKGDS